MCAVRVIDVAGVDKSHQVPDYEKEKGENIRAKIHETTVTAKFYFSLHRSHIKYQLEAPVPPSPQLPAQPSQNTPSVL